MKRIFLYIFILFCFIAAAPAQSKTDKPVSRSLIYVEMASPSAFDNLLKKSAVGEIDGFLGSTRDEQKQIKGCFVNQFINDVEVYQIGFFENSSKLLPNLKTNLQKIFEKRKIEFKELTSFREGFDFSYEAVNFKGFVTVRGMFQDEKNFYITFLVNETYCK
jgi:hypothetical protein